MIRQGEIRSYKQPYSRVLVLSSDPVGEEAYPIVAPLERDRQDIAPYQVALTEQDPVHGSVNLARLSWVNPDLLGEPLGLVSGATMDRIREAVQSLFNG